MFVFIVYRIKSSSFHGMPPQSLIYVVTIAIQVLVVYAIKHHICWWDILKSVHKCCLSCNKGLFSFAGMLTCHPWLTCNDLSDVISGPTLGRGAVKMVIITFKRNYLNFSSIVVFLNSLWFNHSVLDTHISQLSCIPNHLIILTRY